MTRSLKSRLDAGDNVLLDGAVGTELDRRGVATRLPLWSAIGLLDAPEVVLAIHADYVRAGADILTANTFRTTRRTFAKVAGSSFDGAALNKLAVDLAREAGRSVGRDVLVAGSIAPLEDCYSPLLSPPFEIALTEHREQSRWLAEGGADLLMIETMPSASEAEAAVIAAVETGLDVTVGFVVGADRRLLSGESLSEAVSRVERHGVVAVLVNCAPAMVIGQTITQLASLTDLPVGGYANLGVIEDTVGWSSDQSVDGTAYANAVAEWVARGARIVGGCCGTRPDQIASVRAMLDERGSSRT